MNEQYMNSAPSALTYHKAGHNQQGNLIIHIYSHNTLIGIGVGYVNSKTLIVSIYPQKTLVPRTKLFVDKIPYKELR